ncbi:pyridoxamine 5'-phosphate oxidase family protein [Kibdelosporangium philippinense]|uniref:Pyridoxamine 5'-phosphate oxidase family protein n=1 Tax=Kibdelosporangium philippinense TaxID=211113 RepID=A0ABS8ZWA6_9PSEU|nr:pyridoxamine 5'-phosphate oxidase family protein [Kibdelosporangium philippinense]MCE7012000.1 pyridoxamine 5'-phosphate oxidase family protein [Kibdelosporangium philippinense]
MSIDSRVSEVLSSSRVAELTTIGKDGYPQTRPMAAIWVPDKQHVVLTTPPAFPQKVFNIRRDGRVALLYSDMTGTGLDSNTAVLVQGTASAPATVAGTAELADFWRAVYTRNPGYADELRDPAYQARMDWYYWRLPMFVTLDRVHVFDATPVGGTLEPFPASNLPMSERIKDAITRYPTAVLTALDADGHPYSVRAKVDENLTVSPLQPFNGRPGPASLLWHRYDRTTAGMLTLLVTGTLGDSGFTPERIPGALPDEHEAGPDQDWIAQGRLRSLQYLDKRGLDGPVVDWAALAGYASTSV